MNFFAFRMMLNGMLRIKLEKQQHFYGNCSKTEITVKLLLRDHKYDENGRETESWEVISEDSVTLANV